MGAPSKFGRSSWLFQLGFFCWGETPKSKARQGVKAHRSTLFIYHCFSSLRGTVEEESDDCALQGNTTDWEEVVFTKSMCPQNKKIQGNLFWQGKIPQSQMLFSLYYQAFEHYTLAVWSVDMVCVHGHEGKFFWFVTKISIPQSFVSLVPTCLKGSVGIKSRIVRKT